MDVDDPYVLYRRARLPNFESADGCVVDARMELVTADANVSTTVLGADIHGGWVTDPRIGRIQVDELSATIARLARVVDPARLRDVAELRDYVQFLRRVLDKYTITSDREAT
jgi:hypothetical protein